MYYRCYDAKYHRIDQSGYSGAACMQTVIAEMAGKVSANQTTVHNVTIGNRVEIWGSGADPESLKETLMSHKNPANASSLRGASRIH